MKRSLPLAIAVVAGLPLTNRLIEAAVEYQVIDLGTVSGAFRSEARNITEAGLVWCINNHASVPAFTWKNGTTTPIAKRPDVATLGLYQMNDAGQFAGTFSYFTSKPTMAFSGTPNWPTALATNFSPRGLNIAAQVVGFTGVRVESPPGSSNFVIVSRPAIAAGKKLTRLPSLLGDIAPVNAEGAAINDNGAVIGMSVTTNNATHAFLWDGVIHDLHSLTTRNNSVAGAINNNGVVIGYIYDLPTFRYPFLWTAAGGMVALNLPAGYNTGQALGLNERGDIVGAAGSGPSAVIWTNGVMTDLQTLIPTNPSWDLDGAYDINNAGEIVGYGKNGGLTKGFLLRPTNLPPAQLTVELLDPADDGVNVLTGASVTGNYSLLNSLSARRSGIAADGASKLVVRASTTGQGTVSLSLRAADGANGVTGSSAEDGAIGGMGGAAGSDHHNLATANTAQGQRAYALYHAPEIYHRAGFADSDSPQRSIRLQAVFTPDGGPAATQAVSILIVRPPLILMHGLWSNRRDSFGGFEETFIQSEPGVQVFGPTQYPNDVYFRNNAAVVPDEVAAARIAFREQNFAATRADVFSHSMGGVLSRIYAGSTNYKRSDNYQLGDLNRLVTIDSPHRGSFIADIQDGLFPWLSQSSWGQKQRDAIEFLMRDMGKSVTAGASYDLSSTSAEIVKLNQRPTDAAAHVIAGDFEIVADYTKYPPPFGAIYKLFYQIPGFNYTPVRFVIPTDNDLVVSLDSQGAGLLTPPPNTAPSTVYGHHHSGAANTTNVMVRSLFLYRQRPASTWYWKGFPIGWSPPFQAELPPPPASGPTTTNHYLVLLASGPDATPGQQIQCNASPPAGVNFASVAFLTRDASVEDTNSPFTATLTIPSTAAGEYPLSYLAHDAASNTWYGTQMLSVYPPSPPSYMDVEPQRFHFTQLGATRQVSVLGNYFGVIERDLTHPSTGTIYSSADTNVVSVDTNGLMTARGSGATLISITNAGRYGFVDAVVTPSPRSDLALTMTASATNAFGGAPVTFTMSVSNAGTQVANGVHLNLPLNGVAQPQSATVTQGTWSFSDGVFAAEIGTLAPGGEATATLKLVFTPGSQHLNTASVSAIGVDDNSADNIAGTTVNITALPVLAIRLNGTNVIVSWPTNATGYELERTLELTLSPTWNPATTNPPIIGGHFEQTFPLTNVPAYFRLRHP